MGKQLRFFLILLLALSIFPTQSFAGGDMIRVMSRNQYLGADLTDLILAPTPEDFFVELQRVFTQIAKNNFPRRARRLAAEIAFTRPDVVALQEVFDFKVNGINMGPPFVDHLAETLDALSALRQHYVAAATVVNLEITIPYDIDGDNVMERVSVVDRDVLLLRKGIKFVKLAGDVTEGGLCGVPSDNPLGGVFQSRISADGCNYTAVAAVDVPEPIGKITIERGFVGVDATVRGKTYRIVNTHLEAYQPVPGDSRSALFQSLQSMELVGTLRETTPMDRKLILAGDFNSAPDDEPIGSIIPPYQVISEAGFSDIWNHNFLNFDPNGFTCCQTEDLSNRTSELDERIDIIFVNDPSFQSLALVTGRTPIYPLFVPPNWASDHGGVFGWINFIRQHR
jgi:endonuclease/exonuclease/phosphatase family metal-dependent hydrolase